MISVMVICGISKCLCSASVQADESSTQVQVYDGYSLRFDDDADHHRHQYGIKILDSRASFCFSAVPQTIPFWGALTSPVQQNISVPALAESTLYR